MDRLSIQSTILNGLYVLERKPIIDDRGFLERVFCFNELENFLEKDNIRQINHTLTKKKGIVRGMHFQHPCILIAIPLTTHVQPHCSHLATP